MAEAEDKKREIAPTPMSPQVRFMLGFYLLALMVALLYLLITTWPEKEGTADLSLCGLVLGKEGRILLLVSFAGALGPVFTGLHPLSTSAARANCSNLGDGGIYFGPS